MKARMILALVFVPFPHLINYIDLLYDDLSQELRQLLDWFEENYVGRPMRRGNERYLPRFQPHM